MEIATHQIGGWFSFIKESILNCSIFFKITEGATRARGFAKKCNGEALAANFLFGGLQMRVRRLF